MRNGRLTNVPSALAIVVNSRLFVKPLIFSLLLFLRGGSCLVRVSGKKTIIIGTGVCTSLYTEQEDQVSCEINSFVFRHNCKRFLFFLQEITSLFATNPAEVITRTHFRAIEFVSFSWPLCRLN